jgi:hypothetical protein
MSITAEVRWYDEEDAGSQRGRLVRAAWLVCEPSERVGEQRRVLAYLGRRPAITPDLEQELSLLYPDVTFDWAAIRLAVADRPGITNPAHLTDDELIVALRDLARARGLTLLDLSLQLGYVQRQVLPEMMALLDRPENVARFERTSGSIFAYMVAHHPEHAYAIYKARLFLEGDRSALAAAIAGEPAGFGDAAWRERRRHWRTHLEAYEQAGRRPAANPGDR